MYSVYAKKGNQTVCIYNDVYQTEETLALEPKLELSESLAGSFKIKLPASNSGYEFIERLNTEIIVYKEGVEIWSGRVIKEDTDFWKNRSIECEGELAYLNDTTQPQAEYHDITPRDLLQTFLNYHNQKAPADKQFTVGAVTVTDPNNSLYRYTNYESTLEAINDKLCKRLGGYLHIRKVNGVRYVDYLDEHPNTNSQPIEFGKNLLDFTKSFDSTDFCTVLLPLGERLEESPIEALEAYLTVESVNDGSPYVVNQNGVDAFGWICKVEHWDNVTQASTLLSKAQAYLSDVQFDSMELELNAVDLHYTDKQIEGIVLSNKLRVISRPHGLDRYFPITKMSIPLDKPEDTTFTLGDTVKVSYTQRSNEANASIIEEIDTTTYAAKQNAAHIINSFTNGYITIVKNDNGSEELLVSDYKGTSKADIIAHSSRYWLWNANGLGYFRGNQDLGLALTMDGAIVADKISTGVLKDTYTDGQTFYLNLNSGVLKMHATELYIGSNAVATQQFAEDQVTNLTGNQIYTKLAAAGEGIYGYNGHFYINASYLRTGTITIGGASYGNGLLQVRDANDAITHQMSVDGLSSYGKNVRAAGYYPTGYSHTYTVKYGKAGYLTDYAETPGSAARSTYFSNYIGYYNDNRSSTPDAYIGYRGDGVGSGGYQGLVIKNTYGSLSLIGTSIYERATSDGGITLTAKRAGILIDVNNDGHIDFDVGGATIYMASDGIHGPLFGDTNGRVNFSGLYYNNGYGSYTDYKSRIDDAYTRSDEMYEAYKDNTGYDSGSFIYKGYDGDFYRVSFNKNGQILSDEYYSGGSGEGYNGTIYFMTTSSHRAYMHVSDGIITDVVYP